jgi:hypothetical protein
VVRALVHPRGGLTPTLLRTKRIKITKKFILWFRALSVRSCAKVVYPDLDHERQAVLAGRVDDKFIKRDMMKGIFGKQSGPLHHTCGKLLT